MAAGLKPRLSVRPPRKAPRAGGHRPAAQHRACTRYHLTAYRGFYTLALTNSVNRRIAVGGHTGNEAIHAE